MTRLTGYGASNNFSLNDFLYRESDTVADWHTVSYMRGISVDTSFLTPATLRTWIKQYPNQAIIAFGDAANTWLTMNAGNVGIGTTAPGGKLVVSGASGTDSYIIQKLINTSTAKGSLFVIGEADTGSTPFYVERLGSTNAAPNQTTIYNADLLKLVTASGKHIALMPGGAGNVGIGTTAPSHDLFVGSAGMVEAPIYTAGSHSENAKIVALHNDSSTTWSDYEIGLALHNDDVTANNWAPPIAFTTHETGVSGTGNTVVTAAISAQHRARVGNSWSEGDLAFFVNNGNAPFEAMRIYQNGSVGINTASPSSSSKLHVNGNLYIERGNELNFYPSGSSLRAGIGATNTSPYNELQFYVGEHVEKMRIDGSGNVGIGTTDPVYGLHLVGTLGVTGDATFSANIISSGIVQSTGSSNKLRLTYPSVEDFDFSVNSAGALSMDGKITVLQSGSVGIGTTAPIGRFDVQGPTARSGTPPTTPAFYVTGNLGSGTGGPAANNIEFRHDNQTQGIGFGFQTIYATGSTTNQPLNLLSRGSSPITLNAYGYSTGKVGIGVTDPVGKLSVYSAFGADDLAFQYGATGLGHVISGGVDGGSNNANYLKFMIGQATAGNRIETLRLTGAGNVGIGTTAPSEKLDVAGNIAATGVIRSVTVKCTVDTAAATAAKTTSIADYTLTTGDLLSVMFSNGNSVSTPTLNINGTSAINIRLGNTNVNTTNFSLAAGSTALMYYDGAYLQIMGSQRTSDSTTDANMYHNINKTMGAELTQYKIIAEGSDGKFYPLTTGNDTGTTHPVSQQAYKLNGLILYYGTTATVAADALVSNTYTEINTDQMRYTFNQNGGYTLYRPIYIVGTIDANGYFVLDNSSLTSWYTQTLPSSEDGKVYIYLGHVYSTNSMRLSLSHPIYEYRNGKMRMSPEFPGAVLSGSGNGVMTAIVNEGHNCYKWTGNATDQGYDIVVRVPVPDDFSSWPSNSIKWYNKVQDSSNYVKLVIKDTGGTSRYDSGNLTANTSWTQTSGDISAGTFTAGEYMTLTFTVNSDSTESVYIGEVLLTYTKKNRYE
jgi:hypothetical protein